MTPRNPYLSAIRALRRGRVRFLLVGVFGINHYAPSRAMTFSTLDCDILAEPKPRNILAALKALAADGYALEAAGGPLGKLDLRLASSIVRNAASITAVKDGGQVDLLSSVAGYDFASLYAEKNMFRACGTLVPVASLGHLLEAKKRCGRKKDREFLRLYKAQLGGGGAVPGDSRRRGAGK